MRVRNVTCEGRRRWRLLVKSRSGAGGKHGDACADAVACSPMGNVAGQPHMAQPHLGRLEGVVGGEVDVQEEYAAGIRGACTGGRSTGQTAVVVNACVRRAWALRKGPTGGPRPAQSRHQNAHTARAANGGRMLHDAPQHGLPHRMKGRRAHLKAP